MVLLLAAHGAAAVERVMAKPNSCTSRATEPICFYAWASIAPGAGRSRVAGPIKVAELAAIFAGTIPDMA